MLVDGRGDLGGLAIGRGVVPAHDSLQLGEFPDHGRQQVALGEAGGALGLRAIGVDEQGDFASQRHHATHLVADRTELDLKSDRVETGEARRERLLAILAPEEGRVGQARPHHTFVAGAHLGGLAALDVADGDEMRQ